MHVVKKGLEKFSPNVQKREVGGEQYTETDAKIKVSS